MDLAGTAFGLGTDSTEGTEAWRREVGRTAEAAAVAAVDRRHTA